MIRKIIRVIVVRCSLSLSVIIDDQIPREPHEPVLQISLLRIVLIQRAINSNKNFLCQVFSSISARSKAIREVVNPSGVTLNNFLPGRAISGATPANQFDSFVGGQSPYSPH